MADVDWVYLNIGGGVSRVTEPGSVPALGDGKVCNGKGYEVVAIITNRSAVPNDTVIAAEHP